MFSERLQISVVKQTQNLQEHLLKDSMKILHIATLAVLAAFPARADPATVARNFAGTFAIPRFQAVAMAAHAQQDAWTQFCSDRKHGDTKSLTASFNALGDAWAKVEFVRIGPAAVALRVERFNWWLDRTNATGKALDAMLAGDPNDLSPEKLVAGSVAGQGLPIIERTTTNTAPTITKALPVHYSGCHRHGLGFAEWCKCGACRKHALEHGVRRCKGGRQRDDDRPSRGPRGTQGS